MFLKTLTLKGFKSFAEPTVIDLEPGVTVVVGPNGSGKSNVVDAVAWVLGAQGPKVVRSQKMDDVIFAGSGKRPALGRAEVSLTIDNSAHLLPVDLPEITLTRTLFRSGDSEYSLNGVVCRLLDIQELLSDSGVGRTQHVIVGQGQLDWVLNSKPEERRAVIEEAAGVLKFRKRRERSERRLEATHGDLQRLQDLLAEVRRSMRPLQRQADAARRHGTLAAELAALKLYLVGREISQLQTAQGKLENGQSNGKERSRVLSSELTDLDGRVAALESYLDTLRRHDLTPVSGTIEALRERAMGMSRVIEERKRSLHQAEEAVRARSEADRRRTEEKASLTAELAQARTSLGEAIGRAEESRRGVADVERAMTESERAFRIAEGDHQRWVARAEALETAMAAARARAGAGKLSGIGGVLGALAEVVEVDVGWELAFEAAAGELSASVVVESRVAARAALERFAADPAGGAVMAVDAEASLGGPSVDSRPGAARAKDGREQSNGDSSAHTGSPTGCELLRAHVRSLVPGVDELLDRVLSTAVCADGDWRVALEMAASHPDLVVVTREGDRFHEGVWRVGAGGTGANLAALEQARAQETVAATRANDAQEAFDGSRTVHANRRAFHDEAAQEAARLGERVRLVEQRLSLLDEPVSGGGKGSAIGGDGQRFAGPAERPGQQLAGPADAVLVRLAGIVREAVGDSEAALADLAGRRDEIERKVASAVTELDLARRRRSAAEQELARAREQLQRIEIELAENRLRRETAVESLRRDLDKEPEEAMAAECPLLPPGANARQRERELERELKLLGPINPLALEELNALTERHDFLSGQMEDVKAARRDLIKVLRAIDAEIVQVFSVAFEDVSSNFTALFNTLFPGGTGRLVLTDPENLLETGIEMEARPAGKKVNKLSLLSGGERSLVALAFLFAVFRSRPSPFYILDEVEAALDDVSLDRFLGLVDEFRREAQLVIVSHQKRTMEQADSLYGVSMAPGGSSKVISERLRPSSAA